MTRKIVIDCNIQGKKIPIDFYIGEPDATHHPLHFQADFLSKKGGMVPSDVMEAMSKVKELADKNNVPFADLCYYAMLIANGKADEMDIDDVNVLRKYDEILSSDDQSASDYDTSSNDSDSEAQDDASYQAAELSDQTQNQNTEDNDVSHQTQESDEEEEEGDN